MPKVELLSAASSSSLSAPLSEESCLRFRLSFWEKVGALRFSDLLVPLSAVQTASVTHAPWADRPWRGLRVGTGLPLVVLLGRTVTLDSADFVAVYGRGRATLVLELKPGSGFRAVVVTCGNAESLLKELSLQR
jgi:hypothetical protein